MERKNIYGNSRVVYYDPITERTYQILGGNPASNNRPQQPSRNVQNQREQEKPSSGFGYFLAAAAGFVAALITKSLLYEEPE